jgi:hypothetical protein
MAQNTSIPKTAVMRGEVGIPLADLSAIELAYLKKKLTFAKKQWDPDDPPTIILGFTIADDMIWVPRAFEPTNVHPRVARWELADGLPHPFVISAKLDPQRGQVEAVPNTVAYLKAHGTGILVAPTGTGKTLQGLVIGAELGRFIGWPVYASHMEDNVREHAHLIGLTDDDIGLVRGKKCELGKPLTIMYIPSLLRNKYPQALYDQTGTLIADEVNRHGAPEWKKTIAQFAARYRLGMSADPKRKDGLDRLIRFAFGNIAHESPRIRSAKVKPPTVVTFYWPRDYPEQKFARWKQRDGEWVMSDNDPLKYDKCLAADEGRNRMLATEIRQAVATGRKILCFSRLVNHLKEMERLVRGHDGVVDRLAGVVNGTTHDFTTGLLIGSMKKKDRAISIEADVLFTTYAMARDAFNDPKRDTGVFLTPAGDVLQPLGRLREKVEWIDRRPLLWLDTFEKTKYSRRKMTSRHRKYEKLKIPVVEKVRDLSDFDA